MGVLILIFSVALFTHSGALIERSKSVAISKNSMITAYIIEFSVALYFLIAAIGNLNT